MNAPVFAALMAAQNAMPAAPRFAQPEIDADSKLLKVGYRHGDLHLDLYGCLDEDGYEVETVALTGVTTLDGKPVSLADLFSRRELAGMSDWCNLNLPSAAELKRFSRQEARIEHAEWMRSGALSAPV